MALSPREFVEEVEKYSQIIEQRRTEIKENFELPEGQRIKFSQLDLSDLRGELIEITVALHRLYISQQSINNLSSWDTIRIIRKARLIALSGICHIFKEFNNKEESNFWNFYSKEVGIYVNSDFYSKIFEPALIDDRIVNSNWKKTESYLSIIARESDLSNYFIDDVIFLFNIYWKYFYPNLEIVQYINELMKKENGSVVKMLPLQTSEKEDILTSFSQVSDFTERIKDELSKLSSFTHFVNSSEILINLGNFDEFINSYKSSFEYDISYLFKTDILKNKYLNSLPSIKISKLLKILNKLPGDSEVTLPDKSKVKVEEVLAQDTLPYGSYQIEKINYIVSPLNSFDINYFSNIERDKITQLGNKVLVRSFHEFTPYIGQLRSLSKPRKMFKNGKFDGYLWCSNKPILETLNIQSEKVPILPLEPSDNLISDFSLKFKYEHLKPYFKLSLEYLILVSEKYKGKKVNLVNTSQINKLKTFTLEPIGYSGTIEYNLKEDKIKPSRSDLYLTLGKEALELDNINSNIYCNLDETMIFDSKLKTQIMPSHDVYSCSSSRLYMFTKRNFEHKWVSDVCEVSSYDKFGDYNVYEIEWLEKSQPLEINVDSGYEWKILQAIDIGLEIKGNPKNNDFFEYKNNQFHDSKQINIVLLNNNEQSFNIKNLEVKTSYNFDVVSSNIKVGNVNSILERNENHPIIDELFIKHLLGTYMDLPFGRYDFEFLYNNSLLAKTEVYIIPKMEVEEESSSYMEDDEIILTLNSEFPCFKNGKKRQSYLFDKLAKCSFQAKNGKVTETQKLTYYKKAKLYYPFTELNIAYTPDVAGYRFIQDKRLYNTDLLDFYDLDKTSVVVKSSSKDIRLKVNNNVVKPLVPNNMGIVTEQLGLIKSYLIKPYNDVSLQMDNLELSFQVLWNPKVTKFSLDDMLFSLEDGVKFYISYEGPINSYLQLQITDDFSRNLEVKRVSCGEDSAPKFVRYDKHKNSIYLTCDGKSWENREFTIHFEPETIKEVQFVHLSGVYEYNNAPFGELIYKNENFEPDILKLNKNIKTDPKNPFYYFERGFLYSEMNQFTLASNDFDTSINLGLDDEEALGYIELFKESLPVNLLTFELDQITFLAKKLCTDELLLDV